MPDDSTQSSATTSGQTPAGLVISPQLRELHPALVEMIIASESMNNEERQYWIDILPLMTPEQIEQLRTILQNEKDQLAAIDAKYSKQIDDIAEKKRPLQEIQDEQRSKSSQRTSTEEAAREEEKEVAEDILKKMDDE